MKSAELNELNYQFKTILIMKPIIVLVAKGKGREGADWITPKLFNTKEEAEKFIESVNDLDSKYWTYAEIIGDGEEVEPWYGHF